MRRILALLILLAIPAVAQFGGPMGGMRPGSMQGGGLLPGRGGDPLWVAAGPTKPTLDFDFAKRKDLTDAVSGKTSLVNFSRSAAQSPGTYVGSDGLIHDAAVNLALYSEQFENGYWTKNNIDVAVNAAIAPDGKQTAEKITEKLGASAPFRVFRLETGTFSGVYTASFFVKAAGRTQAEIRVVSNVASQNFTRFDLVSETYQNFGSVLPEAVSIEDVGNGWKRISRTDTLSSSVNRIIYLEITGISPGDGVSGIYIWGAQLEETDAATMAPTAYIHTTSQALAAPRFDHTPTTGNVTTNLYTYSESLTSASVGVGSGAAIGTANSETAPDGTQTADAISVNGGNVFRSMTGLDGVDVVWSFYAKGIPGETLKVQIFDYGTSTFEGTQVFVLDGTWQRLSVSTNVTGQAAGGDAIFYFADNRSSGGTATSLHVWGAQLQIGTTLGPYVRTLSETRSVSDANAESLGLLVEEARANLVTRSEEFNLWTASGLNAFGSGSVANAVVAPDGTMTADYIQEDTSTGSHFVYSNTVSISSGQPYTVSVYAKKGERTRLQVLLSGFTNFSPPASAYFDVDGGTIVSSTGTTASITDAGNGWFRCTVSGVASATTTTTAWLRLVQSGTTTSYLGDGTSGLFIWGAQVEQGAFPTSTIPTEGSAQTRYADVAAVQDEDFSTTNLLAYSESFDVGWQTGRLEPVTPNATTAPDGQTTADYIEQQAGQTNAGFVRQYVNVAGTYTFSVYAKAAEKTFTNLTITGAQVWANLTTCTIGTVTGYLSTSATSVGNGWCRISATYTNTSNLSHLIYAADADGSNTVTDSGGIYLWGASLTQTEYPVEYTTTRNLLADSQDFERWTTAQEFSDSGVNAPDGTPTASTISRVSGGPSGTITNGNFTIGAIGEKVVLSVYAKHQDSTVKTLNIVPDNTGTGGYPLTGGFQFATFDLESGTVVSSGAGLTASIIDAGNGWYRCIVSATAVSTGTYTPGFEAPFGASVAIWGAQVEPGTTVTDYVRTVDVVGKSYKWYEPTEGTVFVEGSFEGDYGSATTTVWGISNGTNTYRIQAYFSGGTTPAGLVATPTVYTIFRPAVSRPFDFAHAYTLKHGQHSVAFNGGVSTTSTSLFGPGGLNVMYIGQRADGVNGELLKKHIKRLTYWPRRQSDSTLQVITQ